MAFIYNIQTTITTECLNADVVKLCKNDPLHYVVTNSLDELKSKINSFTSTENKELTKPLSKMKVDELKSLAIEKGIENIDSLTKDELVAIIKNQ